jgi:hypothetical protein
MLAQLIRYGNMEITGDSLGIVEKRRSRNVGRQSMKHRFANQRQTIHDVMLIAEHTGLGLLAGCKHPRKRSEFCEQCFGCILGLSGLQR